MVQVMLVLEEYEHAKNVARKFMLKSLAFGMSSDAYHMTSPPENGAGAALAMENAIRDAGSTPAQIGYVNAHTVPLPLRAIKQKLRLLSLSSVNLPAAYWSVPQNP